MNRLLTLEELSCSLGVSTKTLKRYINHRGLKAAHIGSGSRFKEEWVDQFLEQEANKATKYPYKGVNNKGARK